MVLPVCLSLCTNTINGSNHAIGTLFPHLIVALVHLGTDRVKVDSHSLATLEHLLLRLRHVERHRARARPWDTHAGAVREGVAELARVLVLRGFERDTTAVRVVAEIHPGLDRIRRTGVHRKRESGKDANMERRALM